MGWTFVAADLLTGASLGEIRNAHDRRVDRPLSRMATAQFRIRPDHPQANALLDGDVLVKAYDGGTLRFIGEPFSAEEQAADGQGSVVVSAGGALLRLNGRLIGKSNAGQSYGTPGSQLDRIEIARRIIVNEANGDADTGIRIGTLGTSSLSYVGPWWYKKAAEAITELASAFDGFDFRFNPTEPTPDGSGLALWTFSAAAVLGQDRPDTVFEFGTGKHNVASYGRRVDRTRLLTKGYGLPPGFPDNAKDSSVVESTNPAAIAERGLWEDVVQGDVTNKDLRQRLVDEHVLIRKVPRVLLTFTPTRTAGYRYGTDFVEGDTIRFRACWSGQTRIDAAMRIYSVAWNVDDEGAEQLELSVAPGDS